MIQDEDVAHLVVKGSRQQVGTFLDRAMAERGYVPTPLKGKVHLLSAVNWPSPFEPPPVFRCFMLLPESNEWTTVVDELDRLDRVLLTTLSKCTPVIAVRGAQELGEFEHSVFRDGEEVRESATDMAVREAVEAIRKNPDHVTRFPYDEIYLRLGKRLQLEFRGYALRAGGAGVGGPRGTPAANRRRS